MDVVSLVKKEEKFWGLSEGGDEKKEIGAKKVDAWLPALSWKE